MINNPTHIPNGLMCCGCNKALDRCNHLEFNKMPVIDKKDKEFPVVKCIQYVRRDSDVKVLGSMV